MAKHMKTDRIRSVLRDAKGLTAQRIAELVDLEPNHVRMLLSQMPDTYIERWQPTVAGRGYLAVWNVAHRPPDAMRPKSAPVERTAYDAEYRKMRRKAKAQTIAKPAKASPAGDRPIKTQWAFSPPWVNRKTV